MMRIYIYLLMLLVVASCSELLDPIDDNHLAFEYGLQDPSYGEGLLINAYLALPTGSFSFEEAATDDAVSNDKTNGYLKMATGQWSASFNPVSVWNTAYRSILYLNKFLEVVDDIPWATVNQDIKLLNARRMKGEALALRGVYLFYLLQAHGGFDDGGNLLGVPVINGYLETDADFNLSRAAFSSVIDQIYSDFDEALDLLPIDYTDISDPSELPADLAEVDIADYNIVMGSFAKQRISGRIVKGMMARTALLAASPAFSGGDNSLYEDAADFAAELINDIGGVGGLDPNGHKFYTQAETDKLNLSTNIDQAEMLWRGAITTSNSMERSHFPPSKYGSGRVNPSQNLVDAFPMANGYPITDAVNSGYDPSNPYLNRDPRLSLYILYNGGTLGGTTIYTGLGGGVNAKDSVSISTRTGYYLKKLLREDVNLNPVSTNSKKHYPVHLRYTELFLIYAEAANEAYGPNGTGGNGFSARDVNAAIRQRAGIAQPDNYLLSISTKEAMRNLIRNERRLELCFEGFRFWDLRRWDENLQHTVQGVYYNGSSYSLVNVETHSFQPYMKYGPIPESEILKYSALVQNEGW
jgi:hypothetical protein